MDLSTNFLNEHSEIFRESRLRSGERYGNGTGSVTLAMIGRLAAALRRTATTVERWANGSQDASAQARRHAPNC